MKKLVSIMMLFIFIFSFALTGCNNEKNNEKELLKTTQLDTIKQRNSNLEDNYLKYIKELDEDSKSYMKYQSQLAIKKVDPKLEQEVKSLSSDRVQEILMKIHSVTKNSSFENFFKDSFVLNQFKQFAKIRYNWNYKDTSNFDKLNQYMKDWLIKQNIFTKEKQWVIQNKVKTLDIVVTDVFLDKKTDSYPYIFSSITTVKFQMNNQVYEAQFIDKYAYELNIQDKQNASYKLIYLNNN